MHSIEVEIDEQGAIHPIDGSIALPRGRAVLTWSDEALHSTSMSAKSFADWFTPEEDAAWAYLQEDK